MAIKGLRVKIIEEAYWMIVDHGIENFTVKNLSKKLNISHNTMYRHFKSKSELIYTILEDGFTKMAKATCDIIEKDDLQNIDKYKECAFASLHYAVHNPQMYKLMFATEFKTKDLPEGFSKIYSMYYNQLLKLIEICINSGEIKKGMKKYSILNTTWALLHGIAMLLIDNILPLKKDLDSVPQLLINDKHPSTQILDNNNIREFVRFSINTLIDSFFIQKN